MTTTEEKQLHELKVSELRTELEKRGLDKNGNKAVLTQRLEQAIKSEGHDAQAFKFSVQEPRKSLRNSTTQLEEEQQKDSANNVDDSADEKDQQLDEVFAANEEDESGGVSEANSGNKDATVDEKVAEVVPAIPINETFNDEEEYDEEEDGLAIAEEPFVKESKNEHVAPTPAPTDSNATTTEALPKETTLIVSTTPQISIDTSAVSSAPTTATNSAENAESLKRKSASTSPNPSSKRIKIEVVEIVDSSPPKAQSPPQQSQMEELVPAATDTHNPPSIETPPMDEATIANVEPAIPFVDTEDDVIMLDEPSTKKPEEQQQAPVVEIKQQQSKPKESAAPSQLVDKERDLTCSLWIRNISTSTKAADLKALFSKHGKVLTAKIFTTKNKLNQACFGYMTMSDEQTADACVAKLNRFNFKGRVISVEKANRSPLSQMNRKIAPAASSKQPDVKGKNSPEVVGEDTAVESKRKDRPRITVKESPKVAAKDEPGSSRSKTSTNSTRKHVPSSSNGQRKSATSYSNNATRPVTSSRHVISSTRGLGGYRNRGGGISSGYVPPDRRHLSTSIARRVTRTSSGGYRIKAYGAPSTLTEGRNEPYMPRSGYHRGGYSVVAGGRRQQFPGRPVYETSHRSSIRVSTPPRQYPSKTIADEKEEMLRLMRRREDEHRKKEEELRLQRERERIKYEREKLEREKLELQQLRLTAQLASAAQFQQQFMPPAAAMVPQQGQASGLLPAADSGRSRARDGGGKSLGQKRSPPRGSGQSGSHQRSRSGNNRHMGGGNAGQHGGGDRRERGSSRSSGTKPPSAGSRRGVSPIRGPPRDRTARSSPPPRRNEFVPKQPSLADVPGPHHVMNDDYHAAAVKSFLEGSRSAKSAPYGGSANVVDDRAKYMPTSYGSYRSRGGGGGSARDSHRSPPPTSYRQSSPRQSVRAPVTENRHRPSGGSDADRIYGGGGGIAGSRGRYNDGVSNRTDFGAASRTDPTYASRIASVGIGGSRSAAGNLTADQMFNPYGARASDQVGYQRTSTGSDGYQQRDSSLPSAYQQPQVGAGAYWSNNAAGGGGNYRSGGGRGSFGDSAGDVPSGSGGWNNAPNANDAGLQGQGSWTSSFNSSSGNNAQQGGGRYSGGGGASGYDKHGAGGSSSYGNRRY